MSSALHLYLKGAFFFEMEIELPEFEEHLTFEQNCMVRESFVEYKTGAFKVQYLRQILKCHDDYRIFLVTGSSFNKMQIEE
jgi:hypothetical protein